MKSVDLDYMRKIQNCLPFADEGAGIQETQQAIGEMIAELGELRKQLADLRGDRDTLAGEVEAWRKAHPNIHQPDHGGHGRTWPIICPAMGNTNASGALTRAGKDHP